MKPNEKFYIKSFYCETYEDDFEKGESIEMSSYWSFKDFHLDDENNSFESLDALLDKVCALNSFNFIKKNWFNFFLENGGEETDIGRFDYDVLVDKNNNEATEEEIGRWRKGEKRLWNCHITLHVGVKTMRELTLDDFHKENA